MQAKIMDYPIGHKTTFGPAYEPIKDGERIKKQHEIIRDLMLDGIWRTLDDIEEHTSYPQASISAQLRHLRKLKFGGYIVLKRRIGNEKSGLWEYLVMKSNQRANKIQTMLE